MDQDSCNFALRAEPEGQLNACPSAYIVGLLKQLVELVRDVDDCGPSGEGWQSDELSKLIGAADAVVGTCDGITNLNLYLIERTDDVGYDEYDGYVIAAENEDAARTMVRWDAIPDTPPTVKLVGVAVAGTEAGTILSSYRAG